MRHPSFNEAEREAVYRVIAERRDVRRGFLNVPLPDDLIGRLLAAAHSAPSVGLMQPSRFIVIRDHAIRKTVHQIFEAANKRAADSYSGEQAERYSGLKLEGILEAPQNLCVLCDPGERTRPWTGTADHAGDRGLLDGLRDSEFLACRTQRRRRCGMGQHSRSGKALQCSQHSGSSDAGGVSLLRLRRRLRFRTRSRTARMGKTR